MNGMMKKLISLNMALLLAVLSAYPALAAEADGDRQAEYPDSIGRLAEKELGDGPPCWRTRRPIRSR